MSVLSLSDEGESDSSVSSRVEVVVPQSVHLSVSLRAPSSDLADERSRLLLRFGFRESVLDGVSNLEVALSDLEMVLESVLLLVRLLATWRRALEDLLTRAWRRRNASGMSEREGWDGGRVLVKGGRTGSRGGVSGRRGSGVGRGLLCESEDRRCVGRVG